MELPKIKKSSEIGEKGLTTVKSIVENELNWMFRENHLENDFGIDAYIDLITEFGQVTGKSIALQIKAGDSYFVETNNYGWVYRGEIKHLNYYLNHDIPVIILIVDIPNKKAFWCICDAEKTERAGDNWKITIPFANELSANSKTEFERYISPIVDYASQLEEFWNVNKMLQKHNRLIFIVDRFSVENGFFDELIEGLKRLEVNPELLHFFESKVDIGIHGYDDDPRELRVIPEVKKWINEVFIQIDSWAYYLATDAAAQFLKLIFLCNVEYKVKDNLYVNEIGMKGQHLEVDFSTSKTYFEILFRNFNRFCIKHDISKDTNEKISTKIFEYLYGGKLPQ